MNIIRVFPRKTEMTPVDDMAFYDEPGMFIPPHDEVHVCCVFTWDKPRAEWLRYQWQGKTDKPVRIGGPAYGYSGGDFIPGMYVKTGVTFTSRGCPNNCHFCFVPKREGKLRELQIHSGHIINDNNFLACSRKHRETVYAMLRKQKAIEFKGGLEAARLSDWDIEQMRGLHVKKMFFACDHAGAVPVIQKVAKRLYAAGFKRDHLHCYTLIGDDMQENEARCRAVFEAGMYPRAQLYQPEERIVYSKAWRDMARPWMRPAASKAHMKQVVDGLTGKGRG